MTPEFEVWGKHIADGCPKLLSRHATREEADAEAERKRKLMVQFWDGPQPVYSDVVVKPEADALEMVMSDWVPFWQWVKP